MSITGGPYCQTHSVIFPCQRKSEYSQKTNAFRQNVDLYDLYSFHMSHIERIKGKWLLTLIIDFDANSWSPDTQLSVINFLATVVLACLTRPCKLRKLSNKLLHVSSHWLSCNSCSRLIKTQDLRKLSCKRFYTPWEAKMQWTIHLQPFICNIYILYIYQLYFLHKIFEN